MIEEGIQKAFEALEICGALAAPIAYQATRNATGEGLRSIIDRIEDDFDNEEGK